jgi:tetratricopeptide (TPR) repeat protein
MESLLIHKEIGDLMGVGFTLFIMGDLERAQGNDVKAMNLYEEALHINKAISRKSVIGNLLTAMGSVAICNGDYEKGRELLEETIDLWQKMGDQASVAYSLHYLAWGACLQGNYDRARSFYIETLQLLHHREADTTIAECLIGVGQLMGAQGKLEAFARLLGMALAVAPNIDKMLPPLFRTETEKFTELPAPLGEEAISPPGAGRQTSWKRVLLTR